MSKNRIAEIFARFTQNNPKPTTELNYSTDFELLIAVILSAQTTDISVNKVIAKLYPIANTPEKILNLGEDKLKIYLKSLGLFNKKTKNIIAVCQQLIQKHNSKVPKNRKELQALPGVGRKTANVILNTLYKEPVIAVDTHLFRLANRIPIAKGNTPLKVEQGLIKNIPKKYLLNAHHHLILHGRYICTAKNPKCRDCLIYDLCKYKNTLVK